MKKTIDIPEPLYRQAKIHAAETGMSLKDLVLTALNRELGNAGENTNQAVAPYFARRKLLSGYKTLLKKGAFKAGTDSTRILSEDRDA